MKTERAIAAVLALACVVALTFFRVPIQTFFTKSQGSLGAWLQASFPNTAGHLSEAATAVLVITSVAGIAFLAFGAPVVALFRRRSVAIVFATIILCVAAGALASSGSTAIAVLCWVAAWAVAMKKRRLSKAGQ